MTEKKDWTVILSDQAKEKMVEDPSVAAFVRELSARMQQVMAEFEAGRFATMDEALESIGMEKGFVDLDDEDGDGDGDG